MNIEDYLNNNNESYVYCNIVKVGKCKVPKLPNGYNIPKNYKNWTARKISEHNNTYVNSVNHLTHTTKNIQIIDVDDMNEFNKYFGNLNLSNGPYYKSVTKGLPHYIVKIINVPDGYQIWRPIDKICDLMLGQYTYAPKNEVIINYDKDIIEVNFNDIENIVKMINEDKNKQKETIKNEKKTKRNEEKIKRIEEEKEKKKQEKNKKRQPTTKNFNILEDKILLSLLDVDEIDKYKNWLNIGYAIYNKYGSDGLDMFNKVSSTSQDKYDVIETKKQFNNLKSSKGSVNFGTIDELLKTTDEATYTIYKSLSESAPYIKNGTKDTQVTDYVYGLCKDTYFLTGSDKCKVMYKYTDGVYVKISDISSCLRLVIMEYSKNLMRIQHNICNLINYLNDNPIFPEIIEEVEKIRDIIENIIKYTSSARFSDNILKLLKPLLHIENFEDRLNKDPYILGFGEYVYDLKKYEFRLATRKDYISLSVGVTKEEIEEAGDTEIQKYLKSVFPTEEQRKYILELSSDILLGKTGQVFNLCTGQGANSKSVYMNILKIMMKDYFGMLDSDCITMSTSNNNVSAQYALIKWCRCVFISEPDDGETINIAKLKILASSDPKKAKLLYENPIDFVPQCTLFILCNSKIKLVSPDDDSITRRLRFNKFTQSFITKEKQEILKKDGQLTKNHQLINTDISDEEYIKKLAIELMKLLITVYKTVDDYKNDRNVPETNTSLLHKAEFINSNDSFKDFLNENYVKTKNKGDIILLNDIISDYTQYSRDNNTVRLSKKEILDKMKYMFSENYRAQIKSYETPDKKIIKWYRNGFTCFKKNNNIKDDDNNNFDINIEYDKDGNGKVLEDKKSNEDN